MEKFLHREIGSSSRDFSCDLFTITVSVIVQFSLPFMIGLVLTEIFPVGWGRIVLRSCIFNENLFTVGILPQLP